MTSQDQTRSVCLAPTYLKLTKSIFLSCFSILHPLTGRGGEADQQECGGGLLPASRGETRCQWASGGEERQKVAFYGVGSLEEFLQSAATLARKEILWRQGMY